MGEKSRTYGVANIVRRRIRERRLALNMTQEQLCERAQISVDAVSRIESGLRVPSLPTLERVASALNMTIAELVDDKDLQPAKRPEMDRINHLLAGAPTEVVTAAEDIIRAFLGAVESTAAVANSQSKVKSRS